MPIIIIIFFFRKSIAAAQKLTKSHHTVSEGAEQGPMLTETKGTKEVTALTGHQMEVFHSGNQERAQLCCPIKQTQQLQHSQP